MEPRIDPLGAGLAVVGGFFAGEAAAAMLSIVPGVRDTLGFIEYSLDGVIGPDASFLLMGPVCVLMPGILGMVFVWGQLNRR